MKKIIASVLALIACFSFSSCASEIGEQAKSLGYGKLSDAQVWGAPATEKVLQDKHGIYEEFRSDATVNVVAARGEYESRQIIITAGKKPVKYALQIGT
jgi:hypothetical protein